MSEWRQKCRSARRRRLLLRPDPLVRVGLPRHGRESAGTRGRRSVPTDRAGRSGRGSKRRRYQRYVPVSRESLQTPGAKITEVLLLLLGRDLGDTAPARDSEIPYSRYMNVFGRPPTDRRTASRDGPETGTNARTRQVGSSMADSAFPIYERAVGRASLGGKAGTAAGRTTERSHVRVREPREPRNGGGAALVGQESTSAGRAFG